MDILCSAVIIANPTSGRYAQQVHQLVEAMKYLRRHGWQVELKLTREAGDAGRLAAEAVAAKIQVVVAVGGDGTINEIIQELAGSETALGVLPFGTVNVWARETNIPLDTTGACEVLVHGRTRTIDLGCINERYFLLMAGIGLDAEITNAVEKKPIKRLGVLGYLLVGAWLGLGYTSFRVSLYMNTRILKKNALQIIIGNTQLYGGAIKYTWRAKCDDGVLDVCVIRQRSMLGRLVVLKDFLLHREQRHQWVSYAKCTSGDIRTRKPVAIQVDGDPMGYTPATFKVVPGALKVIVPQETPTGLFSQE
ncbi:MAG: diacylglycerol/lipid kinase family protein [Ktedonobacteraceae bacterium]